MHTRLWHTIRTSHLHTRPCENWKQQQHIYAIYLHILVHTTHLQRVVQTLHEKSAVLLKYCEQCLIIIQNLGAALTLTLCGGYAERAPGLQIAFYLHLSVDERRGTGYKHKANNIFITQESAAERLREGQTIDCIYDREIYPKAIGKRLLSKSKQDEMCFILKHKFALRCWSDGTVCVCDRRHTHLTNIFQQLIEQGAGGRKEGVTQ